MAARCLPTLAGIAILAVACGDRAAPSGTGDAGTGGATGSAGPAGPAGQAAGSGAGTASCEPAVEPFGAEVGQSFPDIQVTTCEADKVTLDELRCGNEITLVSVGAGWCEPCKEEAPELQAAAEALADQGVGVVQVLYQDADGLPATTMFCDTWTTEFALTIPVLIDPVGNTLDFFEQAQTPLNFIVDRDGKVLWAETGKPEDIQATLESFL